MSVFLLKDPDCVFIHVPKTGGSTIRQGLWKARWQGPVFGHVPNAWRDLFAFAFVRHPLERFVSAYADFSQLRGFKGSVEQFLEIATDENVAYDGHRRSQAEDIRHHTLPQTHPFNCLDAANYVARYEDYEVELRRLLELVGAEVPSGLPRLRATRHCGWRDVLSGAALQRALDFLLPDFEQLGYDLP